MELRWDLLGLSPEEQRTAYESWRCTALEIEEARRSMQMPDGTPEVEVESPSDTLDNLFTYHPPNEDQKERYLRIRTVGLTLAHTIDHDCPQSAARTIAMNKLREAVMWANASIATDGAHYR